MWREISDFMHRQDKAESQAVSLEPVVPGDCSDMARLVHMRLSKANDCGCERCTDFLERMHTDARMITREHKNEVEAVSFWCGYVKDPSDALFDFPHEATSGQASLQFLVDHEKFIDSLLAAEKAWLEANSGACMGDTDDYWKERMKSYKQAFPFKQNEEATCQTH